MMNIEIKRRVFTQGLILHTEYPYMTMKHVFRKRIFVPVQSRSFLQYFTNKEQSLRTDKLKVNSQDDLISSNTNKICNIWSE